MKNIFTKEVYVVVGSVCENNGCGNEVYSVISERAVCSSFAKAIDEINEVIKEAQAEAKENGYTVAIDFDDADVLHLLYNGTTKETWTIYKRKIR